MRQIVLEQPRHLTLREVPEPAPAPGEALVRVRRIGVCGTDLHAFEGNQPFFQFPRVLGHELGVEVISAPADGSAPHLDPGDRCAVEPYLNDPDSPASRDGRPNCCESLAVLGVHVDGGMQPLLAVPGTKLHRAPTLDLDRLALVEMLAVGAHAVERAAPVEEETALVVGAGPIGLSVLAFLAGRVRRLVVADLNPRRRAFAAEQFGPLTGLDPSAADFEEALRDAGEGRLPGLVVDATGHRGSMEAAIGRTGHGGRIVFAGIVTGTVALDDPEFHRRELTLLATRNATPSTFRHVLAALESGRVDPRPWVGRHLAFDDVPASFGELRRDPDLVKAVIDLPPG